MAWAQLTDLYGFRFCLMPCALSVLEQEPHAVLHPSCTIVD